MTSTELGRRFGIAAGSNPRDAQLGVAATVPVNRHDSLVRRVVEIDENLVNENMRNSLLRCRIGAGGVPRGGQIARRGDESRAVDLRAQRGGGVVADDTRRKMSNALERGVLEGLQKPRLVMLLHVIVVPQSGRSHALSI
jgi:hypothetical protein